MNGSVSRRSKASLLSRYSGTVGLHSSVSDSYRN